MILLKFNDIKGDSGTAGHEGWITCDGVTFEATRTVTLSGEDRDTSNPTLREVTITKSSDISSCDLFTQACGGSSLGTVTIDWVQTAKSNEVQVYLQVTLAEVIITGYSLSSRGERPQETITLNFTEMKVAFTKFKAGATPEAATPRGWNLSTNTNSLKVLA